MKRNIIIVLLSMLAMMANAQTIHWLTFIDTTDKNVGQIDKTGREILYGHFIDVINAALAEKGYTSQIHDYYDTSMSPQSCKSAVERLSCDPKDIVVFYYIGHGTHAEEENNPYPQMMLGTTEESKFIPLKWVHEQLKSKNPRLLATVGMCCNVVQGARAKTGPTFSVNYGNPVLTDTEKNAIQKMFLGNKGDFLISSASVGQTSIGCPTPFGDMDLFTAILVSIFEEGASAGDLEWESLFSDVKGAVNSYTNGHQTPIFESNISAANMPAKQSIAKPSTTQTIATTGSGTSQSQQGSSNWNEIKNGLTAYFDYIIDPQNKVDDRLEISEKLSSYFSPSAIVKIISQDGNIVVDKEPINTFLGRISTSRVIWKVIPENFSISGNKITELRVKEVCHKQ